MKLKQSYIDIITGELDKLTEDQLYKVLVLVKNTVEANRPTDRQFSKNRALFSGPVTGNIYQIDSSIRRFTEKIKRALVKYGFIGGYGIFTIVSNSSTDKSENSVYICFCQSNVFDAMIEQPGTQSSSVIFTLKKIDESPETVRLTGIAEIELMLNKLKNA